jgi:hypothetical protein
MEDSELRANAEQAGQNQIWVKSNDGRKILISFLEDVTNIYIDSKLRNCISPMNIKMDNWNYKVD